MNWPRGFLRLWIALSVLWIGAFAGVSFWNYAECLAVRPELPFCLQNIGVPSLANWAFILGWPLAALLAGFIIQWIVRGFRR